MYPNNGESLISIKNFKNLKGVIDVVYNPHITNLLFEAIEMGVPSSNGLMMLVAQAVKAAERFTETTIGNICEITNEMMNNGNIVLIGMPDSGKEQCSAFDS